MTFERGRRSGARYVRLPRSHGDRLSRPRLDARCKRRHNAAGVAPAILEAVAAANGGFALAYGDDEATRRIERRFCEIFEREVAVFLVPTRTAVNALALAHLTPVWGAVMCHREAHIIANECGAPEFLGGGLRLVGLDGEGGKLARLTHQRCPARASGPRRHAIKHAEHEQH
jgi:threonine aldolase